MKNHLAREFVQPQTSTLFHPHSNDPYEPTLSDESKELGLEIDMGSNPKTTPKMKTQPKTVPLFLEPENMPLTQVKKTEVARRRPNAEQQKGNTNNQRIVYINFEAERPRLAIFANATIKLSKQRDPGSVEMPMRNGFSIKLKNKEATKLLTPKNIIQEFQKYKVKDKSNNNKSREKIIPCFVILVSLAIED